MPGHRVQGLPAVAVKDSNGKIAKESTITTYWKMLSMYYVDCFHTWMDGKVLFDIGDVSAHERPLARHRRGREQGGGRPANRRSGSRAG